MSIRTEVSETRTCTQRLCHVVQTFFQFFYSYFEKLSCARQPNQPLGEGTKTQPLKAVRFFSLPPNGIWLLERLIPPTTLLIDLEQARKGWLVDNGHASSDASDDRQGEEHRAATKAVAERTSGHLAMRCQM